MIGKELISQKPVSLTHVKELLKDLPEEPSYEQKLTLEYVKKFAKLPLGKAEKLLEELKALESINEKLAVKILDLLPEEKEVLNTVASKFPEVKQDDLEKAFELVKKYSK